MLMVELQILFDTKQTLDAEILSYRSLLQGEDDRENLKQLIEHISTTDQYKSNYESGNFFI